MQGLHSDTHKVDRVAKDERWPNMYGDLNPLPDVTKDMVAGGGDRVITGVDNRPIKWISNSVDW